MEAPITINFQGGGDDVYSFGFHEDKLKKFSTDGDLFDKEFSRQVYQIFTKLPGPCKLELYFSAGLMDRLGGRENVREAFERMQFLPA